VGVGVGVGVGRGVRALRQRPTSALLKMRQLDPVHRLVARLGDHWLILLSPATDRGTHSDSTIPVRSGEHASKSPPRVSTSDHAAPRSTQRGDGKSAFGVADVAQLRGGDFASAERTRRSGSRWWWCADLASRLVSTGRRATTVRYFLARSSPERRRTRHM
jgi:hypothetical protein